MNEERETSEFLSINHGGKTCFIAKEEIPGYEITGSLGWGGMGVVWKANQKSLGRPVAIKILHDELISNEVFAKRFIREAEAVGRLSHPNTIRIYDVGQVENRVFYAMEYIDGKDVDTMIKEKERLKPLQAIEITYQVAMALEEAHSKNIIHRDIKPQNILITSQGHVKLVDFGLAKNVQEDMELTGARTLVGSPRFMAPEQIDGKNVDERTDIYSLGITLYNMITGVPPFDAKTTLQLFALIFDGKYRAPERVLALNPEAAKLINKMMHRDPKKRYRNCTEMLAALEDVILQMPSTRRVSGQFRKISREEAARHKKTRTMDLRTRRKKSAGSFLQKDLLLVHRNNSLTLAERFSKLPLNISTMIKFENSGDKFLEFQIREGEAKQSVGQKNLAKLVVFSSTLSDFEGIELALDVQTDGRYTCKLKEAKNPAQEVTYLFQEHAKAKIQRLP